MANKNGLGGGEEGFSDEEMSELGFTYTGSYKTKQHWEMYQANPEKYDTTTAKGMWDSAISYFKWMDENPIVRSEVLRSGLSAGRVVYYETPRPYSMSSFCLRTGISEAYLNDCANSAQQDDFFFVATRIKQIIRSQILEYTVAGVFNPSVGAKVLGLNNAEKEARGNTTIQIEVIGNAPPLLNEERMIDTKRQITNISDEDLDASAGDKPKV